MVGKSLKTTPLQDVAINVWIQFILNIRTLRDGLLVDKVGGQESKLRLPIYLILTLQRLQLVLLGTPSVKRVEPRRHDGQAFEIARRDL